MIEVVAGLLTRGTLRDRRLLLCQRPADKDFPYTWETPGGKVNWRDVTHGGALSREWFEELGVRVRIIQDAPVWTGEFDGDMVVRPERKHVRLTFYRVNIIEEPARFLQPQEGQGLGWFTESEMGTLALAPGNVRAQAAIVQAVFRTI